HLVRSDASCWFRFFFQAEDGIRDFHVTGVQTCALPISGLDRLDDDAGQFVRGVRAKMRLGLGDAKTRPTGRGEDGVGDSTRVYRSEERRVGKECSSRS